MAQPKTQDNQKVFQSALGKFTPFSGAVEKVSQTAHMAEIYDNMTKMFDAFTKGALLGQGANSELLLRTVYRSLDQSFLQIVQDSDAVDRIVDVMKSKQESIKPEEVDSALVSETTKKVITQTLDPVDYDPAAVALDFIDELQTAILQVKLNLTREYEQKKMLRAKSYEGQQEDLDRLNHESARQNEDIVGAIEILQGNEGLWKDEHIRKLEGLIDTFNSIDGTSSKQKVHDSFWQIQDISRDISRDKRIQILVKPAPKVDLKKLVNDIKGIVDKEHVKQTKAAYETGKRIGLEIGGKQGMDLGKRQTDKDNGGKAVTEKKPPIVRKQPKEPRLVKTTVEEVNSASQDKTKKEKEFKENKKEKTENAENRQDKGRNDVDDQQYKGKGKTFEKDTFKKQAPEKQKKPVQPQQRKSAWPPPSKNAPLPDGKNAEFTPPFTGVESGKKAAQNKVKSPDTKLKVAPDGMCTCPICGHKHLKGGQHVAEKKGGIDTKITKHAAAKPPLIKAPAATGSDVGNDISSAKVQTNLGIVSDNIQRVLKDKKTKSGFMLRYTDIQKGVQKQMGKVDKAELGINRDLKDTEKGIRKLKNKNRGSLLSRLMNGGITGLMFTIIGGLILIALARIAFRKWADAYMPKPDKSKMTIFGVEIPGWAQIKAFGIGIYNFLTVGLANHWDRLKLFFGNLHNSLFGKKGIVRDGSSTMDLIRRVIAAWIVGHSKRFGGAVFRTMMKIFGVAFCWIPGVAPVCTFLARFGPALYTFITNQVVSMWSKQKAQGEIDAAALLSSQGASGQRMLKRLTVQIAGLSRGIKPFKGQEESIPGLQTPKYGKGGLDQPRRKAIIRTMPLKMHDNYKYAAKIQNNAVEQQQDEFSKEVDDRLKAGKKDDILVSINANIGEINVQLKQFKEQWKAKGKKGGREKFEKDYSQLAKRLLNHAFADTIKPQIGILYGYIMALNSKQLKRFGNVSGYLYDPESGWNPGYRIFTSDLQSIIPKTPFEKLHTKPDIYIGQPAGPESTSVGYMPFKWFQDGAEICVNPILYERARAKAILALYQTLYDNLYDDKALDDELTRTPDKLIKNLSKRWIEWNSAIKKHSFLEYGQGSDLYNGNKNIKRSDVVYEDFFARFLRKWRMGQIDLKRNTLDFAKSQISADKGADLATNPNYRGYKYNAVSGQIAQFRQQHADTEKKILKYDNYFATRHRSKTSEDAKVVAETKKQRIKDAKKRFDDLLGFTSSGVQYGKVREFMIGKGVLGMLSQSMVINTYRMAIPLLWEMINLKFLEKCPTEDNANPIHHLMWQFYKFARINGYQWENVDKSALAGFAQVFLEYLLYKVLPQWNVVEKAISNYITTKTPQAEGAVRTEIGKLHVLLFSEWLFRFMQEHLRFPSMKVEIVDYSNADKYPGSYRKLNHYRRLMGIPTPTAKSDILKRWQPLWGRIPSMSDEELQKNMDQMAKLLKGAALEAKYIGDISYQQQLMKYYNAMTKEKDVRVQAKAQGVKIVKKPGGIRQQIVEPPPKTMQEIEDERRRQEAEEQRRAAEQEQKRKDEEEKRLQEERKRQEQVKIAQAKIKAMEAIRKEEEKYETILSKMVNDPGKVTNKELESLGKEVNSLKQEAENRISQLPREERDVKLALIRGDKLSTKTFSEVKETAIGLHGNLQAYVEEVNKIPVGSVMAIQNQSGGQRQNQVQQIDPDSIDMGDD